MIRLSLCRLSCALVRLVVCGVVLVFAGAQVGWGQSPYTYTGAGASIHLLSSWSGSPMPPANFTTAGDVFVIGTPATLTGTLTIAGDNATTTRTFLRVASGGNLDIMAGGILNLQTEGALEVQSGGSLTNSATINAGSGLNNRGFIDVFGGGIFTNALGASINVKGERDTTIAVFRSAGTVTNNGTISIGDAIFNGGLKGDIGNAFANAGAIQVNARGILIVCATGAFTGTPINFNLCSTLGTTEFFGDTG